MLEMKSKTLARLPANVPVLPTGTTSVLATGALLHGPKILVGGHKRMHSEDSTLARAHAQYKAKSVQRDHCRDPSSEYKGHILAEATEMC